MPLSHYKSHINRAEKQSGPPQPDAAAVANIFKEPFEKLLRKTTTFAYTSADNHPRSQNKTPTPPKIEQHYRSLKQISDE
jgi:hypothetical protein